MSFEPAPGPATTRSVLAETEPATFAPKDSARAFASLRVIFSSVPVNTTVLPDTGEDFAGACASSTVTARKSFAISSTLCFSPKNSPIASATVAPIPSIASSSCAAASSPFATRFIALTNASAEM